MKSALRTLALLAAVCVAAAPAFAGDSVDVEPTLEAIQALREDGQVEEAAERATALVAAHPEALDAHMALQDTQLALGREHDLLRRYRDAARRPDATADDHYLLARLLSGSEAVTEYRAALKTAPEHFDALCGLGAELTALGKTKSALQAIDAAEKADPESGVPPNLRGRVEEMCGRLDEAEALYRRAIERDPDLVIARVNLGVLLTGTGRSDAALKVLDAAVRSAPKSPAGYLARGMTRMSRGEADAAVLDFRAAQKRESSLVSLTLLANAYLSLERLEEAAQVLDSALAIDPRHAPTHVMRAYMHLAGNAIAPALASASLAIDCDAKLSEAHHLLGLCHERAGNLKKAEAAYKRAVKLDTNDGTALRALALFYEARGQWKHAMREYGKLVKLTDGAPDAWFDLALAQWGAGKYDKAARSLESLIDVDPAHVDAWLNLGILYHTQLRKRRKAIEAYREYLSLGGKDGRVAGWLADLER